MNAEEEFLKAINDPKNNIYLSLPKLIFIVVLFIFLLVFVVPKGFWISLEKVITYHKDIKPDTVVTFVAGEDIKTTSYRVETTGKNTEVLGFVGKTVGWSIYEYKNTDKNINTYECVDGCEGFNPNRTTYDMLREIEYKPLPETFNLKPGDIVIVAPTKDNGTVTLFGTELEDKRYHRFYSPV